MDGHIDPNEREERKFYPARLTKLCEKIVISIFNYFLIVLTLAIIKQFYYLCSIANEYVGSEVVRMQV